MNTKKKLLLSTLAALVLGLTGCQSSMTVTTDNNQTVVVPKSPSKVVVMNYGALDTLDALGQGSIVVGAPLSVLPSYLEQYKNANIADTGNMKEPSIDAIKQAKPQLIIIDGRQASRTKELSKIAPVINLSVDAKNYLESTKNHINVLAEITDTKQNASNLIQALNIKITNAQSVAQSNPKKAIVAIHNDGKMILINASSSAALIHDVLKVKRAVPFFIQSMNAGDKPKPIFIDNNYVSTIKPDIIYVVDRSKAIGQTAMKDDFFDAKVLATSKTEVVYLTPDLWYLSGGGAESLNRQIDEVINGLN
ncbi:ABC transporter substrate-binding protein [Gilliamella sp. B2776]|uniref:siderophore ABC transporter substrate-binding protein n=1 Tax=unclassified Gilliamella TaxID=2685620 RepID=UPI00226A89AF|nr:MULTISPECIES: ABC transporter substrate-binding protein [unclassified Gilliamella]MCX8650783.1 ABC transporter substrate-binding protein [Gilliamella sp. B2779]MCX8654238.1 ABC transporter substrate-binding protein [Gilliamella sp. B2737]MCX8657107.1 ABC transporter substrate-binding protein [Gilliamella sp. B2894]MCX8664898.1 ABC transporter substrate-binding protein [Gilliamella sp. B2887]MCX8692673.1 ABC transporter substrate-binding protein [Gilliamella sp. B2776]